MTRVHTIRVLRYWLACAIERLLIDLPNENAVVTGRVAEERDSARRPD